ncbi:MAG: FimV/HubP family polar landmark protein [Pseudomonadota bacterium]
MVRKLIKSLLSLSLIAPLSAFALGLGDVHLHSALSERLQANIELLSVNPSEADSVRVGLASQETFDKLGLDRPSILMHLQFALEKGAAGNYSIKITTREPISEPFLDFLVEVNWMSGRVLREYTLLLDPPSSDRKTSPALSTPSTAPSSTTATLSTSSTTDADEVAQAAAPAAPAMMPSEAGTAETSASMAPAPRDMAGGQDVAMPATPSGSIVYGPVKANDTLWRIAQKLRPSEDITVQQMMLALLKANPYAFIDNNINRLKRGYVLRIDDPSMLTAMGKADAVREVARQTRSWQDYRESVAARAKQRPAEVAAVEKTPGAATASKSEPKLTLVSPEGEGADSAAPSGSAEGKTSEAVSEELMRALESSAAQRKENETLKTRLEALEGQLQDMEKIISLKDDDLAVLQRQMHEQGESVELPSEKPGLVVNAEPAEAVVTEELPVQTEATKSEEKPAAVETAVKPAEVKPEAKKPAAKKKPKRKVAPMPVEEPSLLDTLLEDQMMLGAGGGALIFILILLGLIIKRRRKGSFQESILNGGTSSMMKANDEQGSETSFLSDLAISGMGPGTIQTDEGEVDPLTEADVFMAYGRNQQAEEVLKKAREASPDRADIAAKLLEVYYNSKDSAQFEALAEEAVGSLQGNDELWGKVLAMGYELCPENVLFKAGAGTAAPAAAAEPKVDAAADTVMDIGLDLDELTTEMEGEGSGGMDIDLGLDLGEPDETTTEESGEGEFDIDLGLEESEPAAEESSEFDMDLGALDLDTDSAEEESSAEDAGLDFDLDLGSDDEVAAESDDNAMDFDLGDLATDEGEATASSDDMALDLDMGDLTTEEDEGGEDMSLDMDLDMSLDDLGGLDDLGDLDVGEDEMTTKLDLAQAYAEMGDAEGARNMLQEVVSAGSDEQKQQAQALIDKL